MAEHPRFTYSIRYRQNPATHLWELVMEFGGFKTEDEARDLAKGLREGWDDGWFQEVPPAS